jgi:hypothetical protein
MIFYVKFRERENGRLHYGHLSGEARMHPVIMNIYMTLDHLMREVTRRKARDIERGNIEQPEGLDIERGNIEQPEGLDIERGNRTTGRTRYWEG